MTFTIRDRPPRTKHKYNNKTEAYMSREDKMTRTSQRTLRKLTMGRWETGLMDKVSAHSYRRLIRPLVHIMITKRNSDISYNVF